MFHSKTVFVVGAGASAEVGMPPGAMLRDIIRKRFDLKQSYLGEFEGDAETLSDLRRASMMRNVGVPELVAACSRIRTGLLLENSIDDFLDIHKDDELVKLCGKIGIARSILAAEARSSLAPAASASPPRQGPDFERIKESWYQPFMVMLHNGIGRSQLGTIFDNVTFIVFNYDRCIEQFLYWALQATYGIDAGAVFDLMAHRLTIFHPYGTVGDFLGSSLTLPSFGGDADAVSLSDGIRTYTEEVQQGEELKKIRATVAEAHTVIFIGFAFYEQNMDLICPGRETNVARAFATVDGVDAHDVGVVRHRIRNTIRSPSLRHDPALLTVDRKCFSFFQSLGRTLTAR
jgi:hypothetical protein